MRVERRRSAWKGLLAGALGGFAGAFAMSQFHALIQKEKKSSQPGKEDSTVLVASALSRKIFHRQLTTQQKIARPIVHYAFGASTAAIYGMLVEFAPPARAGWGVPFGAAVWLGAHVIMVPAMGFSKPVTRSEPGPEAAEFGAHLVYGAVAESVRRLLRIYLLR